MLSNPMIMCGAIALGIVLLLVIVVVICCKRSAKNEREELKAISEEIEAGIDVVEDNSSDAKIESVLSKMQEAIEMKEEHPVTFEQEQEENAIISYQELLASLGAKSSIDVDSIEVYDDELDNRIEISDFNKEIIDAYQNESLDREIYQFQNDYSSEEMPMEFVPEETPVMNFQNISEEVLDVQAADAIDDIQEVYEARHGEKDYYEAKDVVETRKFKSSDFISPVFGIMNNDRSIDKIDMDNSIDDVEEIIFDDDSF
jgi:hypothetical protein